MNVKKLILFQDIIQTKSFTKSGKRLGYTQAGVSNLLKSLEEEIGVSLFVRTNQGVLPTKEAEELIPLFNAYIQAHQEIIHKAAEIKSKRENHITIASFSSISRNWLPAIIYKFQKQNIGFEIDLMEGGTDEVVQWVETGIADFGLVSKLGIKDLKWNPIYEDPLMAILPKGYVQGVSSVSLEYFTNKPFIMYDEGVDYDVHEALKNAKIQPNIQFTSKDDLAIISMVANELGISILPKLVLSGVFGIVDILPLDPILYRTLGIVHKSEELTPAAKKFAEFLLEELPNHICK